MKKRTRYRQALAAAAAAIILGAAGMTPAWAACLMTGQDLRYDEAGWLAYLTGPEKPFG